MERRETGLSLVEVLVALALLGLSLLVAAAVVVWADRLEARTERRAVALDVAASALDVVRSRPYGTVRDGEAPIDLAPVRSVLPDAEVVLEVEEDEDREIKAVTVEVRWEHDGPRTLRLSSAIGREEIYRR